MRTAKVVLTDLVMVVVYTKLWCGAEWRGMVPGVGCCVGCGGGDQTVDVDIVSAEVAAAKQEEAGVKAFGDLSSDSGLGSDASDDEESEEEDEFNVSQPKVKVLRNMAAEIG